MSAPRRRRVEENGPSRLPKGSRRQALLVAAKQLFATQGYTATSPEQIAAAAGASPAQAARSFPDKSAYLRAILADLFAEAFPPPTNGTETAPDAIAQLHAAVDRLLKDARLEMRVLLRVLSEPDLDADSAAALRAGLTELLEAMARVAQEGQQAGVLRRSPDAHTAAAEVFRAALGYLLVQPYFPPAWAPPADALDGVLHGLLKTDI